MENSNAPNAAAEEIRIQRRENRKAKRIARNLQQEQQKSLIKIGQGSEKLTLINAETLIKYQTTKNEPKRNPFNRKKFNKCVNFADLILRKTKAKTKPIKRRNFCLYSKSFNRLRGKKRENKLKRKHTRLKKSIIASRIARRAKHNLESGPVDNNTPSSNHDEVMKCLQNELKSLHIINSADETEPKKIIPNPYIYSRKFRGYCDNLTSPKLCKLTETLLKDIFRFQKRAYEQNETKARAHKRFVVGFKEAKSFLSVDKIKLVIIAPDCEICDDLDETINHIKSECQIRKIPYMFSLKRYELRYALHKKTPISCVAILNYDGAQDTFNELKQVLLEERSNFKKFFQSTENIPMN